MKHHGSVAMTFLAIVSIGLSGCDKTSEGERADASPDPDVPDATPDTPDGSSADGFTTVISRPWSIPAGSEIYRCTRVTLQEDMYISALRALAPLGTHHTVLSVHDSVSGPDGDYNCGPGTLAHSMIFASGVGTNDLEFPQGVAIRLRAGQQLDLNLHLYNVSDTEITGTSGTQVKLVAAADVEQEAEVVFGGEYGIYLPNDPQNQKTVNGGCQFDQDATVLALWPHMHALGRHMKVTHEKASGNLTLLDQPYDFNEQLHYAIEPVQVLAGERLSIDCTYLNDTGSTVTFGDSSEQEMCFAGIYRYPATGAGLFSCVEFDNPL